ncbi:MAG: OsmC family protein [Candidatus Omnitrophota bacterium]
MEVIVDYLSGMKFQAQCAQHRVIVDLPAESKGTDEGPTPPQYFLTSLASCVGVYVASYCNTSGLDAAGLQIRITADKLPQPTRLDNIKITVTLPNADIGKRKEAILSAAKKCLIHNTLHSDPKVDIELA